MIKIVSSCKLTIPKTSPRYFFHNDKSNAVFCQSKLENTCVNESIRADESTFSDHSKYMYLFLETISELLHFVGKRILKIMNRFYSLGLFSVKRLFLCMLHPNPQPHQYKQIHQQQQPLKKEIPIRLVIMILVYLSKIS